MAKKINAKQVRDVNPKGNKGKLKRVKKVRGTVKKAR